jgi:hypothetical protein
VWAKMTPNIGDIREPVRAAIKGGAVGIAAINTILSCTGVDLETLRPIPTVEGHATYGGAPCAYARPAHMHALRICAPCAYARPAHMRALRICALGHVYQCAARRPLGCL